MGREGGGDIDDAPGEEALGLFERDHIYALCVRARARAETRNEKKFSAVFSDTRFGR